MKDLLNVVPSSTRSVTSISSFCWNHELTVNTKMADMKRNVYKQIRNRFLIVTLLRFISISSAFYNNETRNFKKEDKNKILNQYKKIHVKPTTTSVWTEMAIAKKTFATKGFCRHGNIHSYYQAICTNRNERWLASKIFQHSYHG